VPEGETFPAMTEAHVRAVTWEHCGIRREEKGLRTALDLLGSAPVAGKERARRGDYETRSLHRVAMLIAEAALGRRESRGGHYRSDYPERDEEARHSLLRRGSGNARESAGI
jgi:L-aspartate oxidase